MDKVKKAYVDSRFRTFDSVSDTDFKFELKEPLDPQIILFGMSMYPPYMEDSWIS